MHAFRMIIGSVLLAQSVLLTPSVSLAQTGNVALPQTVLLAQADGNNETPLRGQAAEKEASAEDYGFSLLIQHLIAVVVFSIVGVAVFAISLFIIEKITPFSIIKEIGEEQNVAVSVLVGAIVLGISIIIGASILG